MLRLLGSGSFGVVYLCEDKEASSSPSTTPKSTSSGSAYTSPYGGGGSDKQQQQQLVALKVIDLRERSEEERSMAANEATILSGLRHPHVVACMDAFYEPAEDCAEGWLCMAMEYCEGGDLTLFLHSQGTLKKEESEAEEQQQQEDGGMTGTGCWGRGTEGWRSAGGEGLLQSLLALHASSEPPAPRAISSPTTRCHDHPLDEESHVESFLVLDVARQCLDALSYLHSLGVLHRDVKPSNIYLTATGTVKLGDLGVACLLDPTAPFASTFIGTPFYLSPELCLGEPYSYTADIWAVGVVLYEIYTHTLPFKAMNLLAQLHVITDGVYDEEALARPRSFSATRLEALEKQYGPDFLAYEAILRSVLLKLVQAMLNPDPFQRPSAGALLRSFFDMVPSTLARPDVVDHLDSLRSTNISTSHYRPGSGNSSTKGGEGGDNNINNSNFSVDLEHHFAKVPWLALAEEFSAVPLEEGRDKVLLVQHFDQISPVSTPSAAAAPTRQPSAAVAHSSSNAGRPPSSGVVVGQQSSTCTAGGTTAAVSTTNSTSSAPGTTASCTPHPPATVSPLRVFTPHHHLPYVAHHHHHPSPHHHHSPSSTSDTNSSAESLKLDASISRLRPLSSLRKDEKEAGLASLRQLSASATALSTTALQERLHEKLIRFYMRRRQNVLKVRLEERDYQQARNALQNALRCLYQQHYESVVTPAPRAPATTTNPKLVTSNGHTNHPLASCSPPSSPKPRDCPGAVDAATTEQMKLYQAVGTDSGNNHVNIINTNLTGISGNAATALSADTKISGAASTIIAAAATEEALVARLVQHWHWNSPPPLMNCIQPLVKEVRYDALDGSLWESSSIEDSEEDRGLATTPPINRVKAQTKTLFRWSFCFVESDSGDSSEEDDKAAPAAEYDSESDMSVKSAPDSPRAGKATAAGSRADAYEEDMEVDLWKDLRLDPSAPSSPHAARSSLVGHVSSPLHGSDKDKPSSASYRGRSAQSGRTASSEVVMGGKASSSKSCPSSSSSTTEQEEAEEEEEEEEEEAEDDASSSACSSSGEQLYTADYYRDEASGRLRRMFAYTLPVEVCVVDVLDDLPFWVPPPPCSFTARSGGGFGGRSAAIAAAMEGPNTSCFSIDSHETAMTLSSDAQSDAEEEVEEDVGGGDDNGEDLLTNTSAPAAAASLNAAESLGLVTPMGRGYCPHILAPPPRMLDVYAVEPHALSVSAGDGEAAMSFSAPELQELSVSSPGLPARHSLTREERVRTGALTLIIPKRQLGGGMPAMPSVFVPVASRSTSGGVCGTTTTNNTSNSFGNNNNNNNRSGSSLHIVGTGVGGGAPPASRPFLLPTMSLPLKKSPISNPQPESPPMEIPTSPDDYELDVKSETAAALDLLHEDDDDGRKSEQQQAATATPSAARKPPLFTLSLRPMRERTRLSGVRWRLRKARQGLPPDHSFYTESDEGPALWYCESEALGAYALLTDESWFRFQQNLREQHLLHPKDGSPPPPIRLYCVASPAYMK